MLEIKDLHASVGVADVEILKGVNLTVRPGEVHAIMGPNGSGKSTLAYVLAGHPSYIVTGGDILLEGESLLDKEPEDRARAGVFLSFQHPVEVPGVRLSEFLRAGYNSVRKARGEEELSARLFNQMLRQKAELVEMDPSLIQRAVNEGFSGGERKRNEVLQMAVLEPKLAVLDEPDSGLDVDAVRIVANGIEQLRSPERAVILITHYQRILNYVVPDYVHVIVDGRIVKSGDKDLALEVETVGYDKYEEELEKSLSG
jgi:Fe-S cluster assembly ATP-binding protein